MEKISKEEFENIEVPEEYKEKKVKPLTEEEFKSLLNDFDKPVEVMKANALKMKLFLDLRMEEELSELGYLSEFTRKWLKDYNDLLKEIQKAMFGDKSTLTHEHAVSHATIANRIRKAKRVIDLDDDS